MPQETSTPPRAALDLGDAQWVVRPYQTWVSKTDVVQYVRCPYRVRMVHAERVSYDDFIEPAVREALVRRGLQHEQEALAQVQTEEVTDIEAAVTREALLRIPVLIRNHALGIHGMPDLIAAERGALVPIEIKAHRSVAPLDRLELAFYWRLLAPLRKGRPAPRGYVWTSGGEMVEVRLDANDFALLERTIKFVRTTRETPITPTLTVECRLCAFRDDHTRRVAEGGGLSLLQDVGYKREDVFRQLGITTIADVAEADVEDLDRRWRAVNPNPVGANQLERMRAHARAWLTGVPQQVGERAVPPTDRAVLLDLEYDPASFIFLAGAVVVENGRAVRMEQHWAASPAGEAAMLEALSQLFAALPDHPVITWNGDGADLHELGRAWPQHGLVEEVLRRIRDRHVDLLKVARAAVRLPIRGFGLSEVAAYYGYGPRHSSISGIIMPSVYGDYLRAPNERVRRTAQRAILRHNQDDLAALLLVWQRLHQWALGGDDEAAAVGRVDGVVWPDVVSHGEAPPYASPRSHAVGPNGAERHETEVERTIRPWWGRSRTPPSEEDLRRLVGNEVDLRLRLLLRLAIAGVARIPDLSRLEWRHAVPAGDGAGELRFLSARDGQTCLVLRLPPAVWREVEILREETQAVGTTGSSDSPIFASGTGERLTSPRAKRLIGASARRAGLNDFAPPDPAYRLRKALASKVRHADRPIKVTLSRERFSLRAEDVATWPPWP